MTPWPAVAPKSEISTRLRLDQTVNASVSGLVEVMPLALSCVKIGDSFIFRRMYREMVTRTIEARNGMRQPQSLKASGVMDDCVRRITISETNRPSVAVI